jgi:hypothetical protein
MLEPDEGSTTVQGVLAAIHASDALATADSMIGCVTLISKGKPVAARSPLGADAYLFHKSLVLALTLITI